MSQIVHEQTPRISQVLPTVKCSSCGQPVPLASLGDHICPPLPPPSLLALEKPPISPNSATSLLPQRLQSLVTRSGTPPRKSSDERERAPAPTRDPFHRPASNTPKANTVPLPNPSSSSATLPLDPHLAPARTPPPDRVSTPARDAIPLALQRVRTPSNASRRTQVPSPRPAFPIPFTEPGHSATLSSARRDPPAPSQSPLANRAPSIPTPPPSIPRDSSERARTPVTVPTPQSFVDTPLDKLRPSLDVRRLPSSAQNLSAQQDPFFRLPRLVVPTPAPSSVPFPSSTSLPPPFMSARQPPPPPLTIVPYGMDREIDTKIGGEAGMAGVGRRGFAAAARAAMLSATLPPSSQPAHIKIFGDNHPGNVSHYLDTKATFAHVIRAAITPPLSPNSAYTHSPVSPFPVSPVSLGNSTPVDGRHPDLPSPHDAIFQPSPSPTSGDDKVSPLPFSSSSIRIASPSRSPSPIPNPFERRVSGETITQSPMPVSSLSLPFLNVLKPELDPGNESDDESVYTTRSDLKKDEKSPTSSSANSEVGLAYTCDSDDDTPVVLPLHMHKSDVNGRTNRVKFSISSSSNQRDSSGPSRQASASSMRSAMSSRSGASVVSSARSRSASATTQSTARSTGALERAMETLIEEGASVSVLASGSVLASIGGSASGRGSGKPSRSKTVPGPASPDQKPPKLPTRSHTNPSLPHVHSERVGLTGEVARIRNKGSVKRKERVCAGCVSKIEDGRWIQMDGGNVLCERCWKNMYLPKCRRCNLPIEKQAVSSRDGQLKGKYHRECFNCHTCQKPFPDKEFYVFDEKPFCAYHYHEANNSLCGAPSCGQPIEGPCAVTHSGKRYHPEHLLCEFEGGCKDRLEEYWEVDGQMLCERHAAFVGNRDSAWMRENDLDSDTQMKNEPGADEGRMMKRMTRFIDLAAGGELDIR